MANTIVTVRVPAELLKKLDEEAETRRRSRAFIVLEAIENKFQFNGQKPTAKKAGTR